MSSVWQLLIAWPSTAPDKAPHDEESAPHTSSRDDLIHKEFGEAKRD